MKKSLAVLTIFLLLAFNCLEQSHAATPSPKIGARCSKVGVTTKAGANLLVCSRTGNKLLWIKKADQSTRSKPKSIVFKAKIPITLPVPQNGTITFANITDHVSEIPKVAWQSVQNLIAASNAKSIPHDIFVGPNTPLSISGGIPRIDSTIERSAKLWSGFASTSRITLVYFNLGDKEWAIQKVKDVWAKNGYSPSKPDGAIHGLQIMCEQQASPGKGGAALGYCQGANTGVIQNSTDSLGTFAEGSVQHPDTHGSIVAHELIHTYQHAQWIKSPSCIAKGSQCFTPALSHEFTPCWLSEGQPNSINSMTAIDDYNTYLTDRPSRLDTSQKIVQTSESSIKSFLYDQNPATCYQNGPLYQQGYGPGAMAVEALVAIAGPQATMALFSLGSEGQDFPTAFKNVYGITWDEGSTILAKVLSKEYSQSR
ncbi:unannotated protein [freshwater metagenome]|uniref:Unannotated protein n=1 Tax=freshwater metagenome TaxID=449393 RepID=A0A6J7HF70_9ZZZZ|nr:hypothetical protein [Actinomycetota bacterium]